MANFFGGNRFKEGPGVDKDAPALSPVRQLFAVLSRKFWYFVRFNMFFVLAGLPGLTIASLITGAFVLNMVVWTTDNSGSVINVISTLSVFLVCIPAIAIGPFQAGLTYILRAFVREEPIFMWSDFIDTIKKNWKQSLVVGLLNMIVIALIALDIVFYNNQKVINPYLNAAIFGFVMFILLVFIIMQMYIYPMMITFKLTLRQLYKNAFLFALIKFVPNLGLVLISAVMMVALFLSFNFLIGVFLYIVILPAFIGFMNTSFAYKTIKRYMIDNDSAEIKPENEHPAKK